ncbi:hypothetical protein [Streptomyces alfalfae]
MPCSLARGARTGHWRVASATSTSSATTGPSPCGAWTHGPSPRLTRSDSAGPSAHPDRRHTRTVGTPGPSARPPRRHTRTEAYARVLALLALLALDERPHLLTAWSRPVPHGPQGYPPVVHTAAGLIAAKSTTSPPTTPSPGRRAHAFGLDRALLRAARDVIHDQCRPGPW